MYIYVYGVRPARVPQCTCAPGRTFPGCAQALIPPRPWSHLPAPAPPPVMQRESCLLTIYWSESTLSSRLFS